MHSYLGEREERGFTLIELLIAIVVVGILTAVAIVGIAGLTSKGASAACNATADAVNAAQAVHFASADAYPANFNDMMSPAVKPPELELSGATVNATGTTISGTNGKWSLTVTAAGTGGATPTKMTLSACP
jgi:prepilin-type N-terminal cleavage/methylation domain-containing protein